MQFRQHFCRAIPTARPIPVHKTWKVRTTRAPKLIPVAVETDFEKRKGKGEIIFDRVQLKIQRQNKREENLKIKKSRRKSKLENESPSDNEIQYPIVDLKFALGAEDSNSEIQPNPKQSSKGLGFNLKFKITVLNEILKNV